MENYLNIDYEKNTPPPGLYSFKNIYGLQRKSGAKKWLWGILVLILVTLVLPWTQNIKAKGSITSLKPEQRPYEVNAVIAGTVLKWYVKEGDFVKAGDTLLQIGEVKVDYFDPNLLQRTEKQIEAKQQSIQEYRNKASATILQSQALLESQKLKLQSLENKIAQQKLKINTEEAELVAARNESEAYSRQFQAAKVLLDSGVISLVEFERRKLNYQNALAKNNSTSNKLQQSRQELVNLKIEQDMTVQDYADKIAKAEGEKFASLSNAASAEAEVSKLQNQYSNYYARDKLYFIVATQSGQVTKAKKAGIGEFLKEGEMIVEIVPDNIQYAVEMFVKPMDLPLIHIGQKVRFVFDGFPAIVFSGWPGNSYGTFGGIVSAVEKSVSDNGKFRVLVTEDPQERRWPSALRVGGGAEGIALLKDVKIYYELWRRINGFPPEYYEPKEKKAK